MDIIWLSDCCSGRGTMNSQPVATKTSARWPVPTLGPTSLSCLEMKWNQIKSNQITLTVLRVAVAKNQLDIALFGLIRKTTVYLHLEIAFSSEVLQKLIKKKKKKYWFILYPHYLCIVLRYIDSEKHNNVSQIAIFNVLEISPLLNHIFVILFLIDALNY